LFSFTDEIEQLTEILKVARMGFYETWQEASKATQKLGIRSKPEYRRRYKEDRRLPVAPETVYSDYPGTRVFFGGEKLLTFDLLQKEVRKNKIRSNYHYTEYKLKHGRNDWPYSPQHVYDEWPGWKKFLIEGFTDFLPFSVLQAQVRKAGIKTSDDYKLKYKKHAGWPSGPHQVYKKEWKGWGKFLHKDFVDFLPFMKLKKQVQAAGIKSYDHYKAQFKKHPGWHSNPQSFYKKNWVSWKEFLGIVEYLSFPKFVKAVRAANVKTMDEYKKVYKKHPGWHSAPYKFYKTQWTNWPKMLGTDGKFLSYEKWLKQVRKAKIKNAKFDYKKRYKNFPGWPSTPQSLYKAKWPGWNTVLRN
jgi:hypothetical protein